MTLETLLQDYHFTPLQKIARAIARRWYYVRYGMFNSRYNKLTLEEVAGVPIIVLPQVFNPVLLRSGAFLAQTIADFPFENPAGQSALDMGTGSGIGAVFAAQRGFTVTAVDVNPEAVRCAQLNALLNRLEAQITAKQGDLFEPVAGQQFDLILFNPPYYRGQPRDNLDRAWRGIDIFERFSAALPQALKPHGLALLILSTNGECSDLLKLLHQANLAIEIAAQRNLINEIETIYAVRRR